MDFNDALFAALQKTAGKYKNQEEYRKKWGMPQGTFNAYFIGKTKDPRLKLIASIIQSFEADTFLEFVKNIRPDLAVDVVNLEGKHEVPTYDIGDINVAMSAMPEHKTRESLRHVLRDIPTVFKLQIPEKYFPSEFSVRVRGHSMEPEIPANAAVGLTMLKADRDFVAGEIYLCCLPYEGLVLRRVVVAPGQDALEFQALHIDRDAYRSQIMHPDEALPLIYARMKWVAYRK